MLRYLCGFFRSGVAKTTEDGATLTGLPKTLELTVVLGLEQFGYVVVDTKLKKASCRSVWRQAESRLHRRP